MFFSGRSFDTFESAVAMLIGDASVCSHIDCLAGRAFSLSRKINSELYSCNLSVEDAVENLNGSYGDVFSVVSPFELQEPFIMELHQDIGIPTIFRKYYPHGHFIFCYRKGNEIQINDPDGFPCLLYPIEDLLLKNQTAIIRTSTKPLLQINIDTILQRGARAFHASINTDGTIENCNRLFVQYAIRNYVCQTNKVLSFLCEYTTVPKITQTKIETLFSQMLSLSRCSYDEIAQIDGLISLLLEELLCQ